MIIHHHIRNLFAVFIALIFANSASATHIVGGDLTYTYLGNNFYEIRLTVYRDCENGLIGFDNPASIGIFDAANQIIDSLLLPFNGAVRLQSTLNSPCITPPTNICVESTTYIDTIELAPRLGGYQIAYQRCCRNHIIQNIVAPGATGSTYYAKIPDVSVVPVNNSPVFNQLAPLFLCQGVQFVFDHSATDADGDSLVYSLCDPFDGANVNNPRPQPPNPPPYGFVNYLSPYSLNNVLGGNALTVYPQTGLLVCTPPALGNFVVAVCVKEYRNGELIGETKRDFQFNIVDCQVQVVSSFFAPNFLCNNTVQFMNFSQGATVFKWDFGVPGIDSDTSNLASPTYNFPSRGVYTIKLIAFDSLCSDTSLHIINVFEPQPINAGPDKQVCPGGSVQLSGSGGTNYVWQPALGLNDSLLQNPTSTPDSSRMYYVTADDANGCPGSDSVFVEILPLPFVEAGPDHTTCAEVAVQLSALGAVSYQWSPTTGISNVFISNPMANPAQPIKYYVIGTGANGCSASDSLQIDFFSTSAGEDTIKCSTDTIVLSSVGGISFSWTPSAGLSNSSIATPEAFPLIPTLYVLTATASNGCIATDSVFVDILAIPIADAGRDTSICPGKQTALLGSGGLSFSWSPAGSLSNPATATPIANPAQSTDYVLTILDSNACRAFDTVRVNVFVPPMADAGSDLRICLNDTVMLQASGGDSYAWSYSESLSDTSISNPFAFPENTTFYILSVTDTNGCSDLDTVTVFVSQMPGAMAGNDTSLCSGQSVQISAVGGQNYTWFPNQFLNDTLSATVTASPASSITYYVIINQDACYKTDSVHVDVLQLPNADFTVEYRLTCNDVIATFENLSKDSYLYQWNFGDGNTDNTENPIHKYKSGNGHVILLTATSADGCIDTFRVDDSNLFFDTKNFSIDVPNIITPNGDGKNDCFLAVTKGNFEDCFHVEIYNRWGMLVFVSELPFYCWEGRTLEGLPVPEGVYYYLLEINGLKRRGFVHVMY